MQAAILDRLGPDEPFRLVDLPDAAPGPGEVRLEVRAASVNVVDTKIRAGMADIAPDAPILLGCDVAGIVEAVGPGVTRFAVGDEVYGCAGGVKGRDGAYRARMIADARLLAHRPANLSFAEAAALPLVGITAWEALVERAAVRPGERVLVHGGTGGVGHVGVQLARALGAIVDATVSSEHKAQIATSLGADATIDYRRTPVADYLAAQTGGRGYDVVFDTIGGDNIAPALEALAMNGRCVSIVSLGARPDLTPLHLKNARLDLVFMLLPMLTGEGLERHGAILERLASLVEAGRLIPLLDEQRFTLAEIGAAHARLGSGQAIGKVVVEM
jgi:NADPH:quinone reductase-like Zn-dependent oxidoreductase